MAEVKNAFIKSKMNKDLDDRLIPSGEYRDALNVQVSKSEASDVGALENVIGNISIGNYAYIYRQTKSTANFSQTGKSFILNNVTDLKVGMLFPIEGLNFPVVQTKITAINTGTNTVTLDLKENVTLSALRSVGILYDINCIGYFTDEFNNSVYSFFTDFTDNTGGTTPQYSTQAENFIFKHNISNNIITTLVKGNWLNFSKTKPITGVNLLEDLLFFTDNRNQPRKINTSLANPDPSNRFPTYYVTEDQVSVAKYNPYECIRVISTSPLANAVVLSVNLNSASTTKVLSVPSVTGVTIGMGVTGTGVKTNTFVVSISGNDITTNKVQNLASGVNVKFGGLQTTMQDVSSAKLPDGTTDNPYYNSQYGGDPNFLEDKFIRFSYRFQFDDGENSIFAPFTQPCFIPKQDGYFIPENLDEKDAFESTIVSFMENKVTEIQLQIPLPSNGTSLESDYKIKAIDILYKESDGIAVKVVETIPVDSIFATATGANDVYRYNYQSTKPFKTLPSKELIRVYDKIPVKALSQEVISNRVVYGNFQDKHTPPEALDYQVAVFDKYAKDSALGNKTIVEYPSSTVKQNRNYQVGIILSDKFGRQSSTLLSNKIGDLTTGTNAGFGSSTVYSPYLKPTGTAPAVWPGDSLKILFNEVIASEINSITGTPGLYNGDVANASYNPLGWYSYKVVVQQKEQDYYNVYNAGALAGDPFDPGVDTRTSYISLVGDNINKVPRDLSEVGPQQQQFRSSVRLVGRVVNTTFTQNKQYYPGFGISNPALIEINNTFTTASIENLKDVFPTDRELSTNPTTQPLSSIKNPYGVFFKAVTNPLIATMSVGLRFGNFGVSNPIATGQDYVPVQMLSILETEPDLSLLDFYFETSTSGLISELNTAIDVDTSGAYGFDNWDYLQTEGNALDSIVAGFQANNGLVPIDFVDAPINNSSMTFSVKNGSNADVTDYWLLTYSGAGTAASPIEYVLKTNSNAADGYRYYGYSSAQVDVYTFTFTVTNLTDNSVRSFTETGVLGNIAPTIAGGATQSINVAVGSTTISTQTAVNGTANPDQNTTQLQWEKVSGPSNLSIVATTGVIANNNSTQGGQQEMNIKVTDAGGLIDTSVITFTFGNAPVPTRFNQNTGPLIDGQSVAYYYQNTNQAGTAFPNLNGVNNVIGSSFQREDAQLGGQITPAAPNQSKFVCPSSTPPKYLSKRESKGDAFTSNNNAAFYVQVFCDAEEFNETVFSPVSVEYRNDDIDGTIWVQAKDLNYQDADFAAVTTGTNTPLLTPSRIRWRSSNSDSTPLMTTNGANYTGSADWRMSVQGTSDGNRGSRIFAFDGQYFPSSTQEGGDFRVTIGNLQGTNLTYRVNSLLDCSTTAKTSSAGSQRLVMGDASYAPINVRADYYEYRIGEKVILGAPIDATCATPLSGTSYYAKEWITKYVTQLYTDTSLTTKASFVMPSGESNKLIRFKRNGQNQEGTLEGTYLGYFTSDGLRKKTGNVVNTVFSCVSTA